MSHSDLSVLQIEGGHPSSGSIACSGSKNAVLPMICSCLLVAGESTIQRVPYLSDISSMLNLMGSMGVKLTLTEHQDLKIDPSSLKLNETELSQKLMGSMRASVLLLSALLVRLGEVHLPLPGGCALGVRPIDFHLDILKSMGAEVIENTESVIIRAKNGLTSTNYRLPYPSVTATENALIAASAAKGTSLLTNAACEPEVQETIRILQAFGANIKTLRPGIYQIEGKAWQDFRPATIKVISDRIECGTWMALALATRGNLELTQVPGAHVDYLVTMARSMGANVEYNHETECLSLDTHGARPKAISFFAAPGLSFPTDLQPIFSSVNCVAEGKSFVKDNVFENRFNHVPALEQMGADIQLDWPVLSIQGREASELQGGTFQAKDLRGAAGLLIAACSIPKPSYLVSCDYLDRGYENIDEKLMKLGMKVKRLAPNLSQAKG